MRNIAVLIMSGSITSLFGFALSSWASDRVASEPGGQEKTPALYEVCYGVADPTRVGGKYTTYLSGVMVRGQVNDQDYQAAFAAFVATKYGARIGAECGAANSEAAAQQLIDVTWQDRPFDHDYIGTGWAYSSATSN